MDLYIATRSDRADIVKIGRSSDVSARCAGLQTSQAFWVQPVAIFPGQGARETEIHQALKRRRVEGVPSREWFTCALPEAISLVGSYLFPTPAQPVIEVPDIRPHLEFVRAPRFASTAVEVEALATEICGASWKTALADAGLTRRRGKIGVVHAYRYHAAKGYVKVKNRSRERDGEANPEASIAPDASDTANDQEGVGGEF
jgi:hypothetical protein